MRPGFTTATQWSGAPLPLPMRVSAGFAVTGLSGKMRIHTLPPRFSSCVIARRAASIWRLSIHAWPTACSPNSPKLTSLPRLGDAAPVAAVLLAKLGALWLQHRSLLAHRACRRFRLLPRPAQPRPAPASSPIAAARCSASMPEKSPSARGRFGAGMMSPL